MEPISNTPKYSKLITYFGQQALTGCDGKCEKAWGINSRPRDEEGRMLADHELGEAPADPATYEGGHAKPLPEQEKLNKWCVRECERSALTPPHHPTPEHLKLPQFDTRQA